MSKLVQTLAHSSLRDGSDHVMACTLPFVYLVDYNLFEEQDKATLDFSGLHSSRHGPLHRRGCQLCERVADTQKACQHALSSQGHSHPLAEEKDRLIITVTEFN